MLKIREYRKENHLTIKELAALSGMSISYISQIERGETDPSLSSLRKIANVFQVPIYMLLDDTEMVKDLTLRADQQIVSYSEEGNVSYRFLTPLPSAEYTPEALLVRYEIAPHSQDTTEPLRHYAEEFLYVTDGELTVQIGDREILLKEGDTTVVQKNIPHICINKTDTPTRGYSVIAPPIWERMNLAKK